MKKSLAIILILVSFAAGIALGAVGYSVFDEFEEERIERQFEKEYRKQSQTENLQLNDPTAEKASKSDVSAPEANSEKPLIGEEKAKEIALSDAGVAESEVTYVRAKLDYDDDYNRFDYDVEFRKGPTEYEYEIDAESGAILTFDKDFAD